MSEWKDIEKEKPERDRMIFITDGKYLPGAMITSRRDLPVWVKYWMYIPEWPKEEGK